MEDDFLKLLEEYLDLDEIELKKSNDIEEENRCKISTNTLSSFTQEDTISIGKYVNDYLAIPGDCSNLLHCGLKDLECKYVMGVDNNFANKNPELVHQGYLLLVIDSHNKRGTYINPIYLKRLLDNNDMEKEFKLFSRKLVTDLKKLSEYYQNYLDLMQQITMNQKFYKVLEETHKVKQLKRLIKERNDNNEKY